MEISGHKYFTITILNVCGHVTFKWQQGSVVVELDWSHLIAHPPKPLIRCKNLKRYLLQNPNYSPFVLNFVAMTTRVGWGKILLAVVDGPTLKTNR